MNLTSIEVECVSKETLRPPEACTGNIDVNSLGCDRSGISDGVRGGVVSFVDFKMGGRSTDLHFIFPKLETSNLTRRHLTTVQQVCIPQAILGTDVLCQAKSGLGKTAVFVLTTLQQIEPVAGECAVLVMCHTRELAYQIKNEYARFSKYLPEIKTGVFYGGTPMAKDIETLANKDTHPNIIVATPGRLNALVRDKKLRLGSVKVFVLDECDKMLDQIGKYHVATALWNTC